MIHEITVRQDEIGNYIAFLTDHKDDGPQGLGKTRVDAIKDLHSILDSQPTEVEDETTGIDAPPTCPPAIGGLI